MDPYIYAGTNILINKLNIQDEQQLIDVEAQLLIAGILDISSITHELNFQEYQSLQTIHHYLFHELYSWAGEIRTVNIYKSESVLNGLSVFYSDKDQINADLKATFSWANSRNWSYSNPFLVEDFSTFLTMLWRIHPFREGNTRTVSIFMNLFSESNNLDFNAELLSENAGYLRNALVLAAVKEAPEPKYLLRMIADALYLVDSSQLNLDNDAPNNYQVIGQYDVTNYKEKPFKTNYDTK